MPACTEVHLYTEISEMYAEIHRKDLILIIIVYLFPGKIG